MKFKSKAIPDIVPGVTATGKKLVVPNQSISLEEILRRFTRGEPLQIGRDVQYHESEDDLEKISKMDLVDQEEFRQRQLETQELFKQQEKDRRKAQRKKFLDEERSRIAEELRQKDPQGPSAK